MAANPVARVWLFPGVPVPDLPRRDGGGDGAADRSAAGPSSFAPAALKIGQPVRGYGMETHWQKAAHPRWAAC
jgi:hypothetical protein